MKNIAPLGSDKDLVCAVSRPEDPRVMPTAYVGIPRKAWMQMIRNKKPIHLELPEHDIPVRIVLFAGETNDKCRAMLAPPAPAGKADR